MKIGFIGVGNMASAIIQGIEQKESVYISGRTFASTKEKADQLGVHPSANHRECVGDVDVVVLGVKPEILDEVLLEIKDELHGKVVVSIAAKRSIEWIESILGHCPIIRVMPNLNVKIQEGVCAICHNDQVLKKHLDFVVNVFSNLGEVVMLDESQFSGFIGISGSMPAFIFKFIHEAAKSVQSENIDYEKAVRIIADTMIGSGKLVKESDDDLETLIQKVSSPNGTTVEGTKKLDELDFGFVLDQAIQATIEKDKKG
ncbi:pyrroline-5-carboxylate reductase [Erysipelothrix urinaevulpis]|uniref:pyrroline-5-carboxylate reductase n=1 Tax=Erysipelothrix urinaevulpis TaxID=2683717 RepID=UPI00135BE2B8|nr:pyrroline-5-carboxylate reductase [Erysipelothrix urinaevulpis]